MAYQLPDLSQEGILMKVSFVAILVGDEEKLLVLIFGHVDLESLNRTKRAFLRHVRSKMDKESWDNQLLQR